MNRDRANILAAVAGAILVTGCSAPSASSQPQGQVLALDQVAGYWALTAPDGKRCEISLANLLVNGVRPVLAENCGIPAATEARFWRATAVGFELIGAETQVLMRFRRTGEDSFEAISGGYALTRAPLS